MYTLNSTEVHAVCYEPLEGGAYGVCQNAQCEVRLSQTAYSLSTNSNASGRNSPLVFVYDARGNGGVAYAQQSREITKTE
jgi:hypothetical protein